ncbi:MAG TPA: MFS transporter [Candidatus Obscuribacterales bacterium]
MADSSAVDAVSAPPPRKLAPPREIFSWAMFDFANSGYTTVVMTAVFNAYFVDVVSGSGGANGLGTLLWTVAVGISYGLVVLTAPILGAVADYSAAKKRLLLFCTATCVVFTAMLSLIGPGAVTAGMFVIIVANFMYSTGENLIASFLPELGPQDQLGRISAFGWSIGYLGGLLVLGACLAYVSWAQAHGQTSTQFVPVTMLMVAAVFGAAATPTFLWLSERAVPRALPAGQSYLTIGFSRLRKTLSEATRFQDLLRFLITLLVYSCGTSTVVVLAAVYAEQVMGFKTSDTITMMILVNLTAAAGAFVFGHVQDRLGSVRTLSLSLVVWLAATLLAAVTHDRTGFWIAANLMGIAMGSSQSAGRALVGQFSPPERSAEFFGLWGLSVKLASVIGPLTYGWVSYLTGGDHRQALLVTAAFFAVSLVLLATVNEARGRSAALAG